VVIHLESGDDVVILEGEAREVGKPERRLAERLSAAFTAKYAATRYEYRPPPEQWDRGGLWAMRPQVAFGWSDFPSDTTRWRFSWTASSVATLHRICAATTPGRRTWRYRRVRP